MLQIGRTLVRFQIVSVHYGPGFDSVSNRNEYQEYFLRVKLAGLYTSPNIVRVITSRKMRRAGHVARMGEERVVYRVLVGKPEGKRPVGRPRRRWRIILGCISRRWDVGIWTGLDWPRIETGGGRL